MEMRWTNQFSYCTYAATAVGFDESIEISVAGVIVKDCKGDVLYILVVGKG